MPVPWQDCRGPHLDGLPAGTVHVAAKLGMLDEATFSDGRLHGILGAEVVVCMKTRR